MNGWWNEEAADFTRSVAAGIVPCHPAGKVTGPPELTIACCE